MTHRNTRIPPDRYFQKLDGTSRNKVVVLSKREKRNTEIESEVITVNGIKNLFLPCKEVPSIIGKRGSTQGASTVKIHEKYAIRSSIDIKVENIRYIIA